MDILNFISWIKGGKQVTNVDPTKTLIPLGLKDSRRDDGYVSGAISVEDFANSLGGGGIIEEDVCAGSSVRINSGNCAAGNYSVALGKENIVTGDNSGSTSGLNNKVLTCQSFANGIGNVVAVTGSVVLGGAFNVIACDALSNLVSGGYYNGFVNGVTTFSSYYGDLTAYYTPGSTVSAQYTYNYGVSQENTFDLIILGSSFDGTSTTLCVDPSINTCSGYIIKSGTFSTYSAYHPNIIAGGAFNTICGYPNASTISGGYLNTASNYGTIGGGALNIAINATVGGGKRNMACNGGTISGGNNNQACFTSFVGGGSSNISLGNSSVTGGFGNTSGSGSAVVGGSYNTTSSAYSFIGNGRSNTASGLYSVIAGGRANQATANYAFVGTGFNNIANANHAVVVGGCLNTINTCSNYGSFNNINGGTQNQICNFSYASTISGGYANKILSAGYSFLGGGNCNTISFGYCSILVGGEFNTASGVYSVIVGGASNTVCSGSAIVGGERNTAGALGYQGAYTFIGAGLVNTAIAVASSVVGGKCNTASNYYSVVTGGLSNTASGVHSSVISGVLNTASARYTGILGGRDNTASSCSSFIVGSCITTNRDCTTFVNNLSIMDIPTASAGLPSKSVWFDSATCTLKMVP